MLDFSVLGAEFTDDPQAQLPTEMLHTLFRLRVIAIITP